MPSRLGFVLQVLSLAESIRSARHIRGASNAGADDFAFLELGGRGRAGRRRARQRAYGGGGGGGGGGSGASDAFVNLKPAEAPIHYPGKPVMQPDGTEGAYCVQGKREGEARPSRHECHLAWWLSECSVRSKQAPQRSVHVWVLLPAVASSKHFSCENGSAVGLRGRNTVVVYVFFVDPVWVDWVVPEL